MNFLRILLSFGKGSLSYPEKTKFFFKTTPCIFLNEGFANQCLYDPVSKNHWKKSMLTSMYIHN